MHDHLHAAPILPVNDMPAAAAFYERLGFAIARHDDAYALVVRDGHEVLHLRLVAGLDPATNEASCYLHADDPDAWHRRLAEAGVQVEAVADEPWGMREFAITDPSGNLLRVGCQI